MHKKYYIIFNLFSDIVQMTTLCSSVDNGHTMA